MLDAFIIEHLRRREREDARQQPWLDQPGKFPYEEPTPPNRQADGDPNDRDRDHDHDRDRDNNNGVIIIDM